MSRNLVSDGWHRLASGCPIVAVVNPVDRNAELVIGDRLGYEEALTLVVSDPEVCEQIIRAATEARDGLVGLGVGPG